MGEELACNILVVVAWLVVWASVNAEGPSEFRLRSVLTDVTSWYLTFRVGSPLPLSMLVVMSRVEKDCCVSLEFTLV